MAQSSSLTLLAKLAEQGVFAYTGGTGLASVHSLDPQEWNQVVKTLFSLVDSDVPVSEWGPLTWEWEDDDSSTVNAWDSLSEVEQNDCQGEIEFVVKYVLERRDQHIGQLTMAPGEQSLASSLLGPRSRCTISS